MKLEFQAKFLQHLNKKKQQEEGFTLIELLVVIIIIGILAAIALPSLLAQVNKGKQAEAKQNIGSLNRAQQAYFLEASEFSTDITAVGIGISSQTVNYYYTVQGDGTSTPQAAANIGTRNAGKNTLKSYLGLNFTQIGGDPAANNTEVLALAKLCETKNPDDVAVTPIAPGTNICDQSKYKDLGSK